MATSIVLFEFDSNGTGLSYVGSTAHSLGDSLSMYSTPNMEDLLFKTDKATWTLYDTEAKSFSVSTAIGSLAGKPVNFTGFDGGSTYSFGTATKSEIYYKEGTGWSLYGSVAYSDVTKETHVAAAVADGFKVKGIVFL